MITTKNKEITDKTPKSKGRPKGFCRDDALNQAMQVFCEKGYEASSVAQLGEAMNMKPPSLYNAFGDKEKLFIEVLDHYHKPYEKTVNSLFAEAENTQDAIKKLMKLSKNIHAKKNATGCLIVNSSINVCRDEDLIAQKIKSFHDKNEVIIYKKLREGQKNGDIPKNIKVSKIARYICGIQQGAAVLARGQQSPAAVKDLIDQGYEGFLKLLS